MIYAVNPLLSLKDELYICQSVFCLLIGERGAYAAVFLDVGHLVTTMLLTGLYGDGTVLSNARVDLHALLVRADVHLDTCRRAAQGQHNEIVCFWGRVSWPVEDESVVDSCAVGST